jgi:hypothetical protein
MENMRWDRLQGRGGEETEKRSIAYGVHVLRTPYSADSHDEAAPTVTLAKGDVSA